MLLIIISPSLGAGFGNPPPSSNIISGGPATDRYGNKRNRKLDETRSIYYRRVSGVFQCRRHYTRTIMRGTIFIILRGKGANIAYFTKRVLILYFYFLIDAQAERALLVFFFPSKITRMKKKNLKNPLSRRKQ